MLGARNRKSVGGNDGIRARPVAGTPKKAGCESACMEMISQCWDPCLSGNGLQLGGPSLEEESWDHPEVDGTTQEIRHVNR